MICAKLKIFLKILFRYLLRPSVHALTEVLCSEDSRILKYVNADQVTENTLNYLENLPFEHYFRMFLLFTLIDFAIPPIALKFIPMRWLGVTKRRKYIDNSWEKSRFGLKRMALLGVNYSCLARLYSIPELLKSIGYGPALLERSQQQCSGIVQQ